MGAFIDIVYELPKGVELSRHLQEKALAYYRVRLYGLQVYAPITKEMKKVFKMEMRRGKFIIDYDMESLFEHIIRDIADGVYLQMRDNVCGGIESSLDQELKKGFSKLFSKYIHKRVKGEVVKRLPTPKKIK